MKALIFGVTGQDGHYLKLLLQNAGVSVVGVARRGGDVQLDVKNREDVCGIIRATRPDYIFHLAAESSAAHQYLWENHDAIGTGTLSILDAVDKESPDSRVMLVGSGLQFVNDGRPLDEEAALDHSSPYAIARNYSLFAGRYFRQRERRIYFAFLFNHDSPLRTARHLNMNIAMAAVRIARGSSEKLLIGDLTAEKEFNFAGDVVSALWCLVQQDDVFECVVGSGECYPVSTWVELCFRHVGLDWEQHVTFAENYTSPYRRLVSNPNRLKNLGWHPTMDITQLSRIVMDHALKSQTEQK